MTPDPLHAMQFRAAQVVQVSGMWPASRLSRSDRECPLHTARDRCLWHVGGTPARTTISRLTATAPARPQGEARPGDHRPRWQALIEGPAAPWRLAVVEYEAPVRLQRRVGRVVNAAGRAIGPVPNAGHGDVPDHRGLGEDGDEQQPGSILALPQQHHTARLPGLVGFGAPDRGQREGATANQRPVGLVGGCIPQLGAAPIARVVLTHRHQDDDEDHHADEQPERPEAKDRARGLRDRHGTPFSPEQPDVPHVALTTRSPGWFAAPGSALRRGDRV
jgi:hypothetical protein